MDPDGAFSVAAFSSDLIVVLLFILLGSIFVAAEIALISLREGQIKAMADKGRRGKKKSLT